MEAEMSSVDARRRSRSFAAFSDPDGNGWPLEEIKTRLPAADSKELVR
jgi:hypothetical protein